MGVSDQVIYSKSDYLKLELLHQRTKAVQLLERFRMLSGSSDYDKERKAECFVRFVSKTISLYQSSSALLKKNENKIKKELKELKKIDIILIDPNYRNRKIWIKRFMLLDKALYHLGLLSVEVSREEAEADWVT